MTTTDEKSAGMPATGRFGKLRTLAGRVLRRGPVGPEPVQRRAPVVVAPTGECTARWCLAHDHGARPGLTANGTLLLATNVAPQPTLLTDVVGTELEMPIGQGIRALFPRDETAAVAPEHDARPSEVTNESLHGEMPDDATRAYGEMSARRPDEEAGADSRNTAPAIATAPDSEAAPAPDSEAAPALVPEVLPPVAHTA